MAADCLSAGGFQRELLNMVASGSMRDKLGRAERGFCKEKPDCLIQETFFLGWEDPLEKGKATHSSILAWRIQIRLSD